MEPETATPGPPSKLNFVFYNDRGLRAGWRLLIFAGLLYTMYSLLGLLTRLLGATAGGGTSPPADPPYLVPLLVGISDLVLFLLVLFATWIMSRIERRSMGQYGLPLTRSAWPRFLTGYVLWGFLPLVLVLIVMRAFRLFDFGNLGLHGPAILSWALAWAVVYLMVGFFEEYVFRGYALHTLAEGVGFWPAAVILGVVFAVVHMGNGGETRIGIVGVFLFGLFAATTLRRTGNLWLAVGAHTGWDWGQSFFFGVSNSGLPASGRLLSSHFSQGPDWLTGGTAGPEGSIFALILWAVMIVLFLNLYKPLTPASVIVTADEEAITL
jgi:membrane protease YdiL (CAAX protease family)